MKPNTRLSAFFDDINRIDATRQLDFHQALDRLDDYMNEAQELSNVPTVAIGISGGQYRVEEDMAHVAIAGDISDVRLTSPYDVQRHPDDPAVVMASQILAFTVTRKEPGGLLAFMEGKPRRKRAVEMPAPRARFYLFSLSYDGIQHHTDQEAELSLDTKRFRHTPPLDSYKLGVVRRGGEICLFTLMDNESYGNIVTIMKGSGSIFSSDDSPAEFGPVDRSRRKLQLVGEDKDLAVLGVIDDIVRLTDGFIPTETPPKRGLFRRRKRDKIKG